MYKNHAKKRFTSWKAPEVKFENMCYWKEFIEKSRNYILLLSMTNIKHW